MDSIFTKSKGTVDTWGEFVSDLSLGRTANSDVIYEKKNVRLYSVSTNHMRL